MPGVESTVIERWNVVIHDAAGDEVARGKVTAVIGARD